MHACMHTYIHTYIHTYLEGSDGITGLGGLVVGEGGVKELDTEEDTYIHT